MTDETTVVVTAAPGDDLDGCLAAPGVAELRLAELRTTVLVVGGPEAEGPARHAGARHVPLGRAGRAAARNTGFEAADARWIAFLDGRCRARSGWLAALRDAAHGHAAAVSRTDAGPVGDAARLTTPAGPAGPWISPSGGGAIFDTRLLDEVGVFSSLVRYWDDLYITARLIGYDCSVGQADDSVVDAGGRRRSPRHRHGYWLANLMRSDEMRRWQVQARLTTAAALGHAARALLPPAPGGRLLPVHTRARGADPRAVHLTIDDGPSPNTLELLPILRRHRAKADFFLVGEAVTRYPDVPAQITGAGHGTHNHSLSHRALDMLSPQDIAQELDQAARLIHPNRSEGPEGANGSSPVYVRLPCGAGADDPYLHDAVRRWQPRTELIQWSIDTADHKVWDRCGTLADVHAEAAKLAEEVLASPGLAGSIILMHDSAYGARLPLVDKFSQVLLDRLLTGLGRLGLTTRLLSELEG